MTFWGLELWVLALVIGGMLLLRWRRVGMLTWAIAWCVALFVILEYGFVVPIPRSVVTIYMSIGAASVLAYVSSSRQRWQETVAPLLRLVWEPKLTWLLVLVTLLVPALVAAAVYDRLSAPLEAPAFGRTVHPSPPTEIDVHEHAIDLVSASSPVLELRDTNPEEYARRVENGRRIYYQNCFFCHGDGLGGDGMFAYGLNPIPTNFTDPGVLPNFQESFFFWRAAHGGPGLPEEGGPWDTAMPAWESFLTVDEIWDVIRFLYEFTGFEPRALGHVAAGGEEH